MADSLRGQLLIASPALSDPSFHRSVLLVTEHSEGGAMGVILNRPSETTVESISEELALLTGAEGVIFEGGPVEPEALIVLADFLDPTAAAMLVVGDVGLVSVEAEVDDLPGALRDARVFAGYAGWGPGQLDAELAEDAWIVGVPEPEDLLGQAISDLWRRALERKGGRYLLLSRMPDDPSLN